MRVFRFLWRWFKNLDLIRQVIIVYLIYALLSVLYSTAIIPLRFKYAKTRHDCGIFLNYEYVHHHPTRGGTPWKETWLIMNAYGKKYQFLYLPKIHKNISYIETDLKQEQKVCFEYFNIWLPSHGKTTLKSIELLGEK